MSSFRRHCWPLMAVMGWLILSASTAEASALLAGFDNPDRIEGSYLVLFDQRVIGAEHQKLATDSLTVSTNRKIYEKNKSIAQALSDELTTKYHGRRVKTWHAGFQGFAAEMSEADARALATDPRVAMVVADQRTYLTSAQSNPPWHLDRIDQIHLPLDKSYTYYGSGAAPLFPNSQHIANVFVEIIDSGARNSHQEFNSRLLTVFNYTGTSFPSSDVGDCLGHGTEVAALIGGATYGVAKGVWMNAFRVIGCSETGSAASFLNAIHDITSDALLTGPHGSMGVSEPSGPPYTNAFLVNASVQIPGVNPAVVTAVQASMTAGVVWVSSAGPGGTTPATDACTYTPAGVSGMITVTSSGYSTSIFGKQFDRVSNPAGNYGSCITLFAPGENIVTATYTSDTATTQASPVSGTSFSAPLVTGVVAMYLAAKPMASEADVKAALVSAATPGAITSGALNGSQNLLLYTNVPGNYGNFQDGSGGSGGTGGGGSNSASLNAALLATFQLLLNN